MCYRHAGMLFIIESSCFLWKYWLLKYEGTVRSLPCILATHVPWYILAPRACTWSYTCSVIVDFPTTSCHDFLHATINRPLPFQTMIRSVRICPKTILPPIAIPVWVFRVHRSTRSSFCKNLEHIENFDFLKLRFMKSRGVKYHDWWSLISSQVSNHVLFHFNICWF